MMLTPLYCLMLRRSSGEKHDCLDNRSPALRLSTAPVDLESRQRSTPSRTGFGKNTFVRAAATCRTIAISAKRWNLDSGRHSRSDGSQQPGAGPGVDILTAKSAGDAVGPALGSRLPTGHDLRTAIQPEKRDKQHPQASAGLYQITAFAKGAAFLESLVGHCDKQTIFALSKKTCQVLDNSFRPLGLKKPTSEFIKCVNRDGISSS